MARKRSVIDRMAALVAAEDKCGGCPFGAWVGEHAQRHAVTVALAAYRAGQRDERQRAKRKGKP